MHNENFGASRAGKKDQRERKKKWQKDDQLKRSGKMNRNSVRKKKDNKEDGLNEENK